MSKMDSLIASNQRIETHCVNINLRLDAHAEKIQKHEENLNGTANKGGLNEWHRNFNRRHTLISSLIPTGILIIYGTAKKLITGSW